MDPEDAEGLMEIGKIITTIGFLMSILNLSHSIMIIDSIGVGLFLTGLALFFIAVELGNELRAKCSHRGRRSRRR